MSNKNLPKLQSDKPPPKRIGNIYKNYNFGGMKVGQSFVVLGNEIGKARFAASKYKERHIDEFDYVTRKEGKAKYRLWRINPLKEPQ